MVVPFYETAIHQGGDAGGIVQLRRLVAQAGGKVVICGEFSTMFVRRFAIASSIVVSAFLVLAVAAVAAGGFGPGHYVFKNQSANAFFGMGAKGGPPSASWKVSVNQGLNSFKPTSPDGQRIVNQSTMVFVAAFDAQGHGGYGCFVVPENDFTVSRDLQTASLHTVLTQTEACPGYGTPVGGSKDVVFAGGNRGLVLPVNIDVTWTADGAVTTYKQSFSMQCLDYRQDGSSTNHSTHADALGSISALSGSFNSEFADVNAMDGQFDIQNVPQSACYGY